MIRFFDSHSHLNLATFADDLDAVIERAEAAGVADIAVIGTDLEDSIRAVELAAARPGLLHAVVGVHPHDAAAVDERALGLLQSLAASAGVVAWGEIGLDYHRDRSPRDVQRRAFADQLGLAAAAGLPVVIHDREAHEDVYDIILAEKGYRNGGIIHCFSGDWRLARRYVDLGMTISIPGTITFRKNETQAEVVRRFGPDDLLIETDCPFLAPVPYRGKRNEPAYVVEVARTIANLKGMSLEEAAARTRQNACRVFRLPVGEGDDGAS
ncbi:MAG: TatD family hydrolase [Deltaproteobacteria bacterium]|nr:TatD family hydrolase [Candidatus Anaeroferrophillacea bacterium]